MKQQAAVIGVGQTQHRSRRADVSIAGLFREAADRALDDAGLTLADIDAVVIGKAPDLFEGVMMPELYLADALGAAGKPMLRVHTAGSVGGSTGIVGATWSRPACTTGCSRSPSRSSRSPTRCGRCRSLRRSAAAAGAARAATSPRTSGRTSGAAAPPSTSAAWSRSRTGTTRCKNPYAHLQLPDITSRWCRRRRCSGTRSATSRPARPPTAPARWSSADEDGGPGQRGPPAWIHGDRDAHRADHVRRP